MPISSNQIILDRFTVTHTDLEKEYHLHRAKEKDQEVQIISLSPQASLRQHATQHFIETHENQNPSPIWHGKTQQDLLAIYKDISYPFPENIRLTAEQGEHLLHHLLLQLKKSPKAFPKGLRRRDISVAESKEIMLRATGIIPAINHVRPDVFQTEGTSQQQALYGIAIFVFSLVGTLPSIQNKSDWEDFQKRPPTLQTYLPDAPDSLSHILSIMMDPDPIRREEAFSLQQSVPPFTLDVAIEKKTTARIAPKPITQQHQSIQETMIPKWIVTCSESQIPVNTARKIASLTGINPLAITNPPPSFPIAGAETEANARQIADRISSFGIQTKVQKENAAFNALTLFLLTLGLGIGGSFLSPILGLALIFIGIILSLGFAFLRSSQKQERQQQWNELHTGKNIPKTVFQARIATQSTRKTIMSSHLPDIAKIELHASIDDIDDIIDGHQETKKELSQELLSELLSACQLLSDSIQQDQATEANISKNIKKQSKLVQKLANQMRSL